MDIPTPKNAPIKRHLTEDERGKINADVLDGGSTEQTKDVDDVRAIGRNPERPAFKPKPHLMQRPFAKNPAFAELARRFKND